MGRQRDDTTGQFTETITVNDVLSYMRSVDSPVVTVAEVADALDCSTEAARQKLTKLTDDGVVERKKVGAKAVVWWEVQN